MPAFSMQNRPMQNRKGYRPPPRDRRRGPARPRGYARPAADGPVLLYGWHSVKAALENPEREILAIYGTENALRRFKDEGLALPVEPHLVRPDAIAARLTPDAVHQGILAEANPLPEKGLDDLQDARLVLVLDQVTDPHNVGAMLRSASAFAVDAIVTTARHSPAATGVLAKAASGALEHVPIVSVQNLARGLQALKDQGFQTVGLDSEAASDLADVPLRAPLAVVLGAEGKGLRQLTRETCDTLARLDLPGAIKSLNVSNAAALTLYVVTRALRER
jgi:23S rRNA (guanosine2251-2'-O)-methyltransferase